MICVGQSIQFIDNQGKRHLGEVTSRKGRKFVKTNESIYFFENISNIRKVGKIVESELADQFNTLMSTIDFENKVNSEDKERELIDAAVTSLKNSNEEAKKQTDDDLKSLAKTAIDTVKMNAQAADNDSEALEAANATLESNQIEDDEKKEDQLKATQKVDEAWDPCAEHSILERVKKLLSEGGVRYEQPAYFRISWKKEKDSPWESITEQTYHGLYGSDPLVESAQKETTEEDLEDDEDYSMDEMVMSSDTRQLREEYKTALSGIKDAYEEIDECIAAYGEIDSLNKMYKHVCEKMDFKYRSGVPLGEHLNVLAEEAETRNALRKEDTTNRFVVSHLIDATVEPFEIKGADAIAASVDYFDKKEVTKNYLATLDSDIREEAIESIIKNFMVKGYDSVFDLSAVRQFNRNASLEA